MERPVARLMLDTRSWGPAYCERCDAEVEDVLLMTDASFVCPQCMTPVEGFGQVSGMFDSASALPKEWRPRRAAPKRGDD